MATSFHFPSDHQTNPTVKMNNQTAGRKRSSKNVQKKMKQPQRGMGVEQLERLLMQDTIKNTIPHHQYYSNNFTTLSSFTGTISATASTDPGIYNSILSSSPVLPQFPKLCVSPDFFVQQKVVNNSGLIGSVTFGNQLISSQNMSLYGFPTSSKPITEKSKELSSMPNFMSNSNKSCFADRCLSCNKKKRMINGEDTNIHMENMIRENNHFGIKPSRIEKGVEIVAIHRKGDEGAVVMEYEFFPEKNGSKNTNTSCFGKIISNNSSPESSSVVGNINGEASCVTAISWADTITTPTTSIDLSLKLSC